MIPITHSIEELREKYKYDDIDLDFSDIWKTPTVIND